MARSRRGGRPRPATMGILMFSAALCLGGEGLKQQHDESRTIDPRV